MKRKEEIEKTAMQVAGVHPDWSNLDCFRMGFKEGAKFADKTMLDRACEWLNKVFFQNPFLTKKGIVSGKYDTMKEFITAFRQAMKGGTE